MQADLVIVGGGPAGATTALAIAAHAPALAARTLLLEKERYPRDKPCAGALSARGDVLLRGLGVEADVPSVPIDGVSFRGVLGESTAAPGRIGRVVRRFEFDHALVRVAAARGITVRDGVRVTGVHPDDGGGVVVQTSEGTVRARAVAGCDGVGSAVRRALGLGPGALRAQVVEVDTEPIGRDRDRALIHFDASDPGLTGYVWDFPTVVGGKPLVCRGVYRLRDGAAPAAAPQRAQSPGADVGGRLDHRLAQLGVRADRRAYKRYAERGYEPAGLIGARAMILVGESAGIDPATGEGIAQAIEYGVLAGRFLAERLGRPADEPVDLGGWTSVVSRSRLGRDLRIRSRAMRLFHGPARLKVERLLVAPPDLLYVGCQYFGAQRCDWLKITRLAARWMANR